MKKFKSLICIFAIFLFSTNFIFAKKVKEEKVYDQTAFSIMMNYGAAWSQVTRIQVQENRSNFVWQDWMIGLFYSLQTRNAPLNFYSKISAYYPYHYEFNKFPQVSKQVILYAFDFDFGPIWTIPFFELFKINLAPVLSLRYQLSDKFHHFDAGGGGIVGFEFPITKGITILLNGEFIYSFGNLGTNAKIQLYNHTWNYGAQLGVRISKRSLNSFYYFKSKKNKNDNMIDEIDSID